VTTRGYAPKVATPCSSHATIVRLLDEELGGRPAARVLDVGCASGLLRRTAAHFGLRVADAAEWVGVDHDQEALRRAAAAGLRTHAIDVSRDGPDGLAGPWSAVVFADVLEHLPRPDLVLARWLPAVCGPDTLVLVSLPNVANLLVRLMLAAGRFDYHDQGILDRSHLRFYTRRSARALLEDAGLVIGRIRPTPVPLSALAPAARVLAAAERVLALPTRAAPTLLGYQFVFEARYAHAAA
jgi:SAM-dependent methyltransferase